METVGLGFYWNDLEVGYKFKTVGRTVTETDITNFVNCTGMVEVLFTNLEFLENRSSIKGRVAPAALAYCFAEGLLIQATMQETGLAFLNMELDVLKPVFCRRHHPCGMRGHRGPRHQLGRSRPGAHFQQSGQPKGRDGLDL